MSVDETVLKSAKRILDLSELLEWQNEALFIPLDRGGWRLWKLEQRRDAAGLGAPMKEQSDADLRALALEDLTRENDALSAGFDVEAFGILRRTPTDSDWREVIVHCGSFVVEHDERNDKLWSGVDHFKATNGKV